MTTKNEISRIKSALNKMQKDYYRNPQYFLNERDAQCRLYTELFKRYNKLGNVEVRNKKGDLEDDERTIPLHAELYKEYIKNKKYKKNKPRRVDLCIILDTKSIKLTSKHKGKKDGQKKFYEKVEWEPDKAIGIEIKYNDWYYQKDNKNKQKERFRRAVKTDLKKLNDYKHGIFILVDRESVYNNKEWYDLIHELMPKSSSNRRLQSIKAYYLSPSKQKIFEYPHI
jgi:hypothetical protein